MCTLSVVGRTGPRAGDDLLFRVVVNRDERRTRAEALPPVVRRFGGHDAILPIDPESRGTWIGVNSAGVVLGLLNANPPVKAVKTPGLRSRGQIIPGLLSCGTVAEAATKALSLDAREYPPFRLIAIEADRIAALHSDGLKIDLRFTRTMSEPFLATSSSLGDHVVERPRRELFRNMLAADINERKAQDAFHRHFWPDHKHLSVEMSRPDARTVSRTVIEVCTGSVRMTYRSLKESAAHSRIDNPRDLLSADRIHLRRVGVAV